MPAVSLLIKPVSGNCDLQCTYCFYRDETKNRSQESFGRMEESTLEVIIKKALEYADTECTIAYQGGEPTLRGLEFYRKSLEYQRKHNVNHVKINNAIQTNGYGIDEFWARFFAEHDFLVGLSIDGIKRTHDMYRTNSRGEGSFERIMRTVQMFRRYGVEFNILTVVNRQTAKQAEKIYRFYQKNQFHYLQFIPCLDPLTADPGRQEYSLTPEAYGEFLKALFDLWYEDVKRESQPYIRYFENIAGMMLGLAPEACDQRGICGMQYVIEADGSVYPCDFYVLDEYRLGNLVGDSFEQIDEKRTDIKFVEASTQFSKDCRNCGYFYLCRGGCRRHRIIQGGSDDKSFFCRSYQMFYEYTMGRWQALAYEITKKSEYLRDYREGRKRSRVARE